MSDAAAPIIAYDAVAYPSAIFLQTHPDRMAVIAKLHGLSPPPVDTARVLEIGGGDGLNLIALAAAYPRATFDGFDLAESAVRRGKALIAEAGMTNVTLSVRDILNARRHYAAGSFDYVIAHGVYAWVPAPVRRALMALIGHVLAPDGVAFVSYNALPGGHIRHIMRDMLMHELEGITDPDAKITATRRFLTAFAVPQADDDAAQSAIRAQAMSMLERPDSVLFHDELGPEFAPQSLGAVTAAAQECGLRFLSDAGRNRHMDGFLPDHVDATDDPEAQVWRRAQSDDFASMRFFRQTMLVRHTAQPNRRIDAKLLKGLWASANLVRTDSGSFQSGEDEFAVTDDGLSKLLDLLSAKSPDWIALGDLGLTAGHYEALLELFTQWYVTLHSGPAPFACDLSERPCISALVRAQLRTGQTAMCNLDHHRLSIEQAELRNLLVVADGTRTIDAIAAMPDIGFPADQVPAALEAAARRALVERG